MTLDTRTHDRLLRAENSVQRRIEAVADGVIENSGVTWTPMQRGCLVRLLASDWTPAMWKRWEAELATGELIGVRA